MKRKGLFQKGPLPDNVSKTLDEIGMVDCKAHDSQILASELGLNTRSGKVPFKLK